MTPQLKCKSFWCPEAQGTGIYHARVLLVILGGPTVFIRWVPQSSVRTAQKGMALILLVVQVFLFPWIYCNIHISLWWIWDTSQKWKTALPWLTTGVSASCLSGLLVLQVWRGSDMCLRKFFQWSPLSKFIVLRVMHSPRQSEILALAIKLV